MTPITPETSKTPIVRPVLRLDTQPQVEMFAPHVPRGDVLTPKDADKTATRRFCDLDPETISIGNESLRAFLMKMNLDWVLLVRETLREIDWEPFESMYATRGRAPYAPAAMMGLILFGTMQGKTSLRQLELLARSDLSCMWISGQIFPDHSVLGRFIQMHTEQLTDEFFKALTQKVLKRLGGKQDGVLAGDGTLIESMASAYHHLKLEAVGQRLEQAEERLKNCPDDAPQRGALEQAANEAQALARIAQERALKRQNSGANPLETRLSLTDPEAVFHKLKRGNYRFGFVPSLLVNRERLILSAILDAACEKVVVAPMLEQAERVLGHPVSRLLLDAGYATNAILALAVEKDIDLLVPCREQSFNAKKTELFRKSDFRYDAHSDTLICPAGQVLKASFKANNEDGDYTSYRTSECATCPLRAQCTKAKDRGRTIRRKASDDLRDAMRQIIQHPVGRKRYSQRQSSVEPVFAELRNIQYFNRFRRRGLVNVRMEFSLHAMAHNLRRLCKLVDLRV